MRQHKSPIRAVVCIASLALACASNGSPPAAGAPAEGPGVTAGLGLGSVLASVLYAPVKIVYAAGGAIVGSLAWIFTGGDGDTAMAIYRPSMSGDYLVTPTHLRDPGSLEFIGRSHVPGALAAVSAAPPSEASVCTGQSSVHFAFGEATLDAAARRELDRVARELQSCSDERVRIQGHADSTGEAALNRDLSERRARAVERYLVDRGVERSRVTAMGLGTSEPLSSNATAEGRAANRRAEIALLSR